MKHFKLGLLAAIIALLGGHAFAADLNAPKLPSKPAMEAAIADVWGGCYVEAGVSAKASTDAAGSARSQGAVAGLGCNTRVAPGSNFVGGVFARFGLDVHSVVNGTADPSLNRDALLAGRFGYLIAPLTLTYGVLGYDIGRDAGRNGIVGGVGLEVKPHEKYSLGAEYLQGYRDNGSRDQSVVLSVKRAF